MSFGYKDWIYPSRAIIYAPQAIVLAGAAQGFTRAISQTMGSYWWTNGAANGDSWGWNVYLAEGTYSFLVLGASATSAGKVDWYLDGSTFTTGQDWYTTALTYNVTKTTTNVTVTGSGVHTLKSVINGKNASSSNYYLNMTYLELWTTDATNVS